jgi:hypothetical protein
MDRPQKILRVAPEVIHMYVFDVSCLRLPNTRGRAELSIAICPHGPGQHEVSGMYFINSFQAHEYNGPPLAKYNHKPVRRASLGRYLVKGVRDEGYRLLSVDAFSHHHPRQFVVNVQETMDRLVATEDTDGNYQITIEDGGPKVRI